MYTNRKLHHLGDDLLLNIGFEPTALLPQLFVMYRYHHLFALAANIFDAISLCGLDHIVPSVIDQSYACFTLGTIIHGPEHPRYFGLYLFQREDMSVSVDGDVKLTGIHSMSISRLRRRGSDSKINAIESRTYTLVNTSIRWL